MSNIILGEKMEGVNVSLKTSCNICLWEKVNTSFRGLQEDTVLNGIFKAIGKTLGETNK